MQRKKNTKRKERQIVFLHVLAGSGGGGAGGDDIDRDQKRFIYRLLTRHDFLPVWLVADK
jgi:hypothetical protein